MKTSGFTFSTIVLPLLLTLTSGTRTAATEPVVASTNEEAEPIRVMSFNIRYGTASDGVNHWNQRKEFLVETIRAFSPDLLGTQETLGFQRDFLAEHLPDFEYLGVGRDDGKEKGEMMALYYRRDRYQKQDSGHFWLSETPDVVGSRSWGTSLPRMVTWVRLIDRKQTETAPVLFMNTHFDHQSPQAREQSAHLLREKAVSMGEHCSVIVTGDFNAGEDSEPWKALFLPVNDQPSPLVDSYRSVHPERTADEGTFSGFESGRITGPRIDWIAVSRDWTIKDSGIDHTSRDGRTPSDHFPVFTIIHRR